VVLESQFTKSELVEVISKEQTVIPMELFQCSESLMTQPDMSIKEVAKEKYQLLFT